MASKQLTNVIDVSKLYLGTYITRHLGSFGSTLSVVIIVKSFCHLQRMTRADHSAAHPADPSIDEETYAEWTCLSRDATSFFPRTKAISLARGAHLLLTFPFVVMTWAAHSLLLQFPPRSAHNPLRERRVNRSQPTLQQEPSSVVSKPKIRPPSLHRHAALPASTITEAAVSTNQTAISAGWTPVVRKRARRSDLRKPRVRPCKHPRTAQRSRIITRQRPLCCH